MKILHTEASSSWGGQEIRILREAIGMRERGHEVILVIALGGILGTQARQQGFTVYELSFKRKSWLFSLFRLLRILKKHQIQLVNTHSSLDAWLGAIAARLAGCSVVRTRHLSGPIKKGLNSRLLYGKLADFVVTTCASIIPMISLQSGKSLELCRSIPTGVDLKAIQPDPEQIQAFKESLGIVPGDFLVGTACFMRSWKGIPDFLKAADLGRDNRKLKWVIIGGGHEATYRKMAADQKLEGIVYFTGHLKDPFPAIASLDAFALLSTANEGVSQSILQAAFLKKPLIATPIGGSQEVCLEAQTGFQVAPFSPEQVLERIVKLQEDLALQRTLGQNAHQLVIKSFTWEQTLLEMEKVYEIVEKGRSF